MMWEVAARRGREFPRSMSDFKPGELYFTLCRFLALDFVSKRLWGELCFYALFAGNIQFPAFKRQT